MNEETGPTDPQARLAAVVANANRPPEPPKWVQKAQIALAVVLFLGAFWIAHQLVTDGPPPPKTPESSTETAQQASDGEKKTALLMAAGTDPAQPDGGGGNGSGTVDPNQADDGESGGAEEEGSSSGESLASLNEQAPWAFAIVALLVGAFLATGKTLSFSGVGRGETEQ